VSVVGERPGAQTYEERYPRTVVRYTFWERLLHWVTTLAFIYLMLSGFALGYPRMTWLYDVLGGGQTVRFIHPIVGVVFTVGATLLLVVWFRDMTFNRRDGEWVRSLRTYVREGHAAIDTDRFNAGQKSYFWFAVVTALILLLSGIPLWVPGLLGAGWNQVSRLVHHVFFLLTVGGFIVHVYMSTVMLPGTVSGMTSGRVTRTWAAWHHPRWFRRQENKSER
jgi:formate dehydrogenase subunit gamma